MCRTQRNKQLKKPCDSPVAFSWCNPQADDPGFHFETALTIQKHNDIFSTTTDFTHKCPIVDECNTIAFIISFKLDVLKLIATNLAC